MPLRAIARLIQTMLYAQRFFPYYVYNILGGIEDDGMFIRFIPLAVHGALSVHLVIPPAFLVFYLSFTWLIAYFLFSARVLSVAYAPQCSTILRFDVPILACF